MKKDTGNVECNLPMRISSDRGTKMCYFLIFLSLKAHLKTGTCTNTSENKPKGLKRRKTGELSGFLIYFQRQVKLISRMTFLRMEGRNTLSTNLENWALNARERQYQWRRNSVKRE